MISIFFRRDSSCGCFTRAFLVRILRLRQRTGLVVIEPLFEANRSFSNSIVDSERDMHLLAKLEAGEDEPRIVAGRFTGKD